MKNKPAAAGAGKANSDREVDVGLRRGRRGSGGGEVRKEGGRERGREREIQWKSGTVRLPGVLD